MYNPQHNGQNKSDAYKIGARFLFCFDVWIFFFSYNRKQEGANMLAPQCPQGLMILSFCSAALIHGFQFQGHFIVQDIC